MSEPTPVEQQLAGIIAEHPFVWSEKYCRCESGREAAEVHNLESWSAHVAAVLAAELQAVSSALPQPDLDTIANAIWHANCEHQNLGYSWEREVSPVKAHYRRMAQAAIDAGVGR